MFNADKNAMRFETTELCMLRFASESLHKQFEQSVADLNALRERQKRLSEAGRLGESLNLGEQLVQFVRQTDAAKAAFILTTASYVEALANLVLSSQLDTDQFKAVDCLRPLDKWTVMIPLVVNNFRLPKGERTHQLLNELISERNALTHSKPKVEDKDKRKVVHEGKGLKYVAGHGKAAQETLKRWCDLPRELIRLVRAADEKLGDDLWMFAFYEYDELQAALPRIDLSMLPGLHASSSGD